jgi:hypothetical protein
MSHGIGAVSETTFKALLNPIKLKDSYLMRCVLFVVDNLCTSFIREYIHWTTVTNIVNIRYHRYIANLLFIVSMFSGTKCQNFAFFSYGCT